MLKALQPFLTRRWLLAVGGLILALAAVVILLITLKPHTFGGTLIQSPGPAYDFALPGPEGKLVHLSDYRGKVVILFFGYSFCPDVCPVTLGVLRRTADLLGKRAEDLAVVMVTVDPERDTVERINRHVQQFNPAFVGLSADMTTTLDVSSRFGVFFQKREGSSPELYTVDHTATTLLIDQKGYLRVVYPYGTPAEPITADIEYILTH